MLDSITREAVSKELLRVTAQQADETVQLLVFDTDKPADSLTHLPPVKAAMQRKAAVRTQAKEEQYSRSERETVARDSTAQHDSLSSQRDVTHESVSQSPAAKSAEGFFYVLGAFGGLLLVCTIIYLIIILKK